MADETLVPTASGGLDRTPLAHVLVYCLDRSLTGTLVLESVEMGSNALLIQSGAITGMMAASLPAPTFEEDLLGLFAMSSEGQFAFYDGVNLLSAPTHENDPLDPRGLLAAGVRANPNAVPLDRTLGALVNRRLRFMSPEQAAPFLADPFVAPVARAVQAGESRIGELLNLAVAPELVIRSSLYAMLILRVLDLGSAAKPPVAAPGCAARMPRFSGAPTSTPQMQSASRISVSTPAAASSQNDDPRVTEIRQIASQINQRTLFEALGVTPESTADEVKEAYFALAKVWHPDRLPPELTGVRTEVNTVFARMSLAYQTLIDANRRKAYVTELASQQDPEEQAQVARVLDAASEFQKAEVMLKKGDLAIAEELALRAVKADPQNPDYDTLLAWVRAIKPGTGHQEITLCVGVLSDVLRQHPDHQRALWYRGNLLKRIGNEDLAVDDFRKLLKLKPNSVDAEREIRLYEMRNRGKTSNSQPPAATASAAIDSLKDRFGKLFKR